jgi:hypothetical protein
MGEESWAEWLEHTTSAAEGVMLAVVVFGLLALLSPIFGPILLVGMIARRCGYKGLSERIHDAREEALKKCDEM